jgi:hypothetical protein
VITAARRRIYLAIESGKVILLVYIVARCLWKGWDFASKATVNELAQKGSKVRRQRGRRSGRDCQSPPMIRQLAVAVAMSLPTPSKISARENATRRPDLTTVPTARRVPLSLVTGRV